MKKTKTEKPSVKGGKSNNRDVMIGKILQSYGDPPKLEGKKT